VIVVLFVAGGVLLLFIDEARALRVVQSAHAQPPRDDAERFRP
jgi:hypothetical protein